MSNFGEVFGNAFKAIGEKAQTLAKDAANLAEEQKAKSKERAAAKQMNKQRDAARNKAVSELTDAVNDLKGFLSVPGAGSEYVGEVTKSIMGDAEKLRDLIYKMTPVTLVPILQEFTEKWLDEAVLESNTDNLAQRELDKKECARRRDAFVNRCAKAIDALNKQVEKEENSSE